MHIVCLLVCGSCILVHAKTPEDVQKSIDSLEFVQGFERYDLLERLLLSYSNYDPNLRLDFAREAYELAQRLQLDSAYSNCDKNLGIAFFYLNQLDSSEFYFRDALAKYTNEGHVRQMVACNNNLGIISMNRSDLIGATNFYLEARQLLYELKDSSALAKVSHNIGSLKKKLEEYPEALEAFFRSLEIRRNLKGEKLLLAGVYHNIASVHHNVGNKYEVFRRKTIRDLGAEGNDSAIWFYEQAQLYVDSALQSMEEHGNDRMLHFSLELQAHLHALWERHEEAVQYIDSAISIAKRDSYSNGRIASIMGSKGDIFYLNKNFDSSLFYYNKTIELALSVPDEMNALAIAHQGKARVYIEYNLADSVAKHMLLSHGAYKTSREKIIEGKLAALDRKHEYFKRVKKFEEEKQELEAQNQRNSLFLQGLLVLLGVVGVFVWFRLKAARDIKKSYQKLRDLNYELNASREELNEAVQVKDRFFSIIAHDLKNPVAAFGELASTLNTSFDQLSKEDQQEFLQALDDSATHVSRLLENLLMWSRSQRNTISFDPQPFDLAQIVSNAIDPLQIVAHQKNIDLQSDVDSPNMVVVDANMVQTIVRNTVSNALKFTDSGGEVTVSSQSNGKEFSLIISDSGVGMTDNQIHKLFKVDEVVSTNGTHGENGTGLGLIICKEFIDKHEGSIQIHSEPGKGTTFEFVFPQQSQVA